MSTFMVDVCSVSGVDVSSMMQNGHPLLPHQLLVSLTGLCTPKMIGNGFDPRCEFASPFPFWFFCEFLGNAFRQMPNIILVMNVMEIMFHVSPDTNMTTSGNNFNLAPFILDFVYGVLKSFHFHDITAAYFRNLNNLEFNDFVIIVYVPYLALWPGLSQCLSPESHKYLSFISEKMESFCQNSLSTGSTYLSWML